MPVPDRVPAFLDLAAAAQLLASGGNRYAAYHCQQAVEKLVKALLLHPGIEAGVEHHLDVLIARLRDQDPWRARLRPFERYSTFGTAWRYPTPGGRIPSAPDPAQVIADAKVLEALVRQAKTDLLSS